MNRWSELNRKSEPFPSFFFALFFCICMVQPCNRATVQPLAGTCKHLVPGHWEVLEAMWWKNSLPWGDLRRRNLNKSRFGLSGLRWWDSMGHCDWNGLRWNGETSLVNGERMVNGYSEFNSLCVLHHVSQAKFNEPQASHGLTASASETRLDCPTTPFIPISLTQEKHGQNLVEWCGNWT